MPMKSLALALLLYLYQASAAQLLRESSPQVQPDSVRSLSLQGHSLYRTGKVMVISGVALFPLAILAWVPVMYDGAFGITAADPGFGSAIAAAGMGLVHIGIPLMGKGAELEVRDATPRDSGELALARADWEVYLRSWKHMSWGAAVFATPIPFALLAALDVERGQPFLGYAALGLAGAGGALIATGLGEQYWCGYRFVNRHRNTHATLMGISSLSLRPWIVPAQDSGLCGGLALVAGF